MDGIDNMNLFMMCESLRTDAGRTMPQGYHFRCCRRSELPLWKRIHFDLQEVADEFSAFMDDYFQSVYAANEDLFFESCVFACDESDKPVATCFVWRAYDSIYTLHWFKVVREHEGRGVGRALLYEVMRKLSTKQYPVYLHTHPASLRAMKLYSDFGFALLTDAEIGYRSNDLAKCLPYLEQNMPRDVFDGLRFASATDALLKAAKSNEHEEF